MGLFSQKRNYDTLFKREVNEENAVAYSKDFRESFADQWNYQTYTANSYSRVDNLHDEFAKEIEKIKEVTGVELDNPYHTAFGEFFIEDVAKGLYHQMVDNPFKGLDDRWSSKNQQKIREQERLMKFYKKAEDLRKKYPDLQFRSAAQIQDDIIKKAHEYYNKVNDGRDVNGWGDFLGAAGGAVIDPINATLSLATGGMGNTAKTTVGKALARTAVGEFIENAGIEALIQPSVYEYKQELGLPYSKAEAALNVAAAGVGGAALGTTIKGLHISAEEMLGKFKKATAKGVNFDGDTKEAAAILEKQVEFDKWSKSENPYGEDLSAKVMHESNIIAEMERMNTEQTELSLGYDRVLHEPTGDPFEVISELSPEDMEKIIINRGAWKDINEKAFSEDGFGLVKFIFKHGEKSSDSLKLSKQDIVDLPRIVREWSPVESESNEFKKVWRIEKDDGQRVFLYAKRFVDVDDRQHGTTMYLEYDVEKNKNKPLSKKKSSLDGGLKKERELDTNTQTSNNLFREGPAAKAEIPEPRFLDGALAATDNIDLESPKVKDFENISLDNIEKELSERADLSAEEKELSQKTLNSLRDEEKWDSEIVDCIVEFSKK